MSELTEARINIKTGENCPACGQRTHGIRSSCELHNNPHSEGIYADWSVDPHRTQMENLRKISEYERSVRKENE